MAAQDDNILVQSVVNGDNAAYRELVVRHQARIFYLGLKFFHAREEAEDFTQEVFLKAFMYIQSFKREVPFSAWLYKLAFNHAVNKYRLDKRAIFLTDTGQSEAIENLEDNSDAELLLLREEMKEQVLNIIKELPDVYQIMIKMHFYDNLSYKIIAQITKIPVNTIKSHIFRAKKIIREKMESYL